MRAKARKSKTVSSATKSGTTREKRVRNSTKSAKASTLTRNSAGRDDEVDDALNEESGIKTCPGQPTVTVVEMEPILRKLGGRKNFTWSAKEKTELANFMRNRAGIDASDKRAIADAGLHALFESWFAEYVDLYERDRAFELAIDPWQIIVTKKPLEEAYIAVLNDANSILGGCGKAGDPKNPIKFQHGTNWMLHIPTGEEDAKRIVAHMKRQFEERGAPDFEAVIQDFRSPIRY